MNDIVTHPHQDNHLTRALAAPAHGAGINAGAVAIESQRAVAEVLAQVQIAKAVPRSISAAMTEFMDACKSPEFAAAAFYSVPNRGSGPSIRFAEELARCYGNFEFGHRELSRSAGKSEVEVYAWDKEKNNRSIRQITVEHVVDTKNGPKPCRDQSDIDNLIANKASKQVRGRILAIVPKHMAAAGIAECKKTIAGHNDKPLRDRIIGVAGAFAKYGVTNKMLEKHLGHPVDDTTSDELADLIGIGNALKEGGKPSEYFPQDDADKPEAAAPKAIADAAASKKTTAPKPGSKPTESASKPAKDAAPESGEKVSAAGQKQDDSPVETTPAATEKETQEAPPAATGDDDDVF